MRRGSARTRRPAIALPLAMFLALTLLAANADAGPAEHRHKAGLPVAPRLQWNSNFGYCGETSFISAGMYFGQYTSQWTARKLASPHVKQWHERSQLLLGVNDLAAARRMKLRASRYAGNRPRRLLVWAGRQILGGHVPIIGVFNNVTRLGEPKSLADPVYDHIVPVVKIDSRRRLNLGFRYHPRDTLTLSDNGLYRHHGRRPFLYRYRFRAFPRSRRQADARHGPLYSLRAKPPNFGTSILGVRDPGRDTVPVRLTSSAVGEGVENRARLRRPPRASRIELTAHAKLYDPGLDYNVYMYRSFEDVPVRDFNANADAAVRHWYIPSQHIVHWRKTVTTRSDRTRVFRAVPADAP